VAASALPWDAWDAGSPERLYQPVKAPLHYGVTGAGAVFKLTPVADRQPSSAIVFDYSFMPERHGDVVEARPSHTHHTAQKVLSNLERIRLQPVLDEEKMVHPKLFNGVRAIAKRELRQHRHEKLNVMFYRSFEDDAPEVIPKDLWAHENGFAPRESKGDHLRVLRS
jgi:hypothetical protein